MASASTHQDGPGSTIATTDGLRLVAICITYRPRGPHSGSSRWMESGAAGGADER